LEVEMIRTLFMMAMLVVAGCGDKDDAVEGQGVGDCTDGADNDADGLFDCQDDGCAASPDCAEEEADADTDSDTDSDTDADTDADTDSDTDVDCDSNSLAIALADGSTATIESVAWAETNFGWRLQGFEQSSSGACDLVTDTTYSGFRLDLSADGTWSSGDDCDIIDTSGAVDTSEPPPVGANLELADSSSGSAYGGTGGQFTIDTYSNGSDLELSSFDADLDDGGSMTASALLACYCTDLEGTTTK